MEDQHKIEATLFTTGRFMSIEEIAQVCGVGSVGYVKDLLKKIKEEYENKEGSITIVEQDNKYKMNIKKQFGYIVNKLVATTEFDNPTTKTLAVVAYRNPALQSDIIKIRGNKAYEHVKLLREQGLVTTERTGRTRTIKLTPRFYEYFDTAEEKIKEEFEDIKKAVEEKYKDQIPPEQTSEKPAQTSEELPSEEDKQPQ